jgi:pyruvate,water dikinase
MISILKKIIFFLFRRKNAAVHDTTALQVLFRGQYRYFRSLLTANNNCLELMAEIEQAKQGDHPFSMAFVRSHCTALSANVLKMINLLQKLNEKQYQHLLHPYQSITQKLEEILTREPAIVGKDLIITLDMLDRNDADQVGEKMANIGELRNRAGLLTPEGFVITAAATQHFFLYNDLNNEINRRLTSLNSKKLSDVYAVSAAIEKLIIEAPLPADLESAILEHYQNLTIGREHDMAVALRSSALGEDSRRSSFAGIYRSKLHVQSADLIRSYKEIVAGKYRTRAIMYRLQRGFRHEDVIMCVGCMVMVDGAVSGVMYSRPPDDLRGEWVEITAAAGLADKVVSGQAVTERYRIDRNVESPELFVEQNTFADGLTENSKKRLLSPAQQAELASIAVRLEHHFGSPMVSGAGWKDLFSSGSPSWRFSPGRHSRFIAGRIW